MKKKKLLTRVSVIPIIALAIIALVAGYFIVKNIYFSPDKKSIVNNINTAQAQINQPLSKKLEEEVEVFAGQVHIRNNVVNGNMVIKDGASKERVDELVEKYANELKNEYKGKKVSVQAVSMNGKPLARWPE